MKKSVTLLTSAAILCGLALTSAPSTTQPVHAASATQTVKDPIADRNQTEVLTESTVTADNTPVYSSPTAEKPTSRVLPSNTKWHSVGQLNNGFLWFHLGGDQWVRGIDLMGGHIDGKDPIDDRNQTEVLVNHTVTADNTPVYTSPTAAKPTSRILASNTKWQSMGQLNNGILWFHLGGDQWVRGIDLMGGHVDGNNDQPISGTITINYVAGFGVNLWTGYQNPQAVPNRKLIHGTSWRVFKQASVNGRIWYNVGGNQWVDGRYATLKN